MVDERKRVNVDVVVNDGALDRLNQKLTRMQRQLASLQRSFQRTMDLNTRLNARSRANAGGGGVGGSLTRQFEEADRAARRLRDTMRSFQTSGLNRARASASRLRDALSGANTQARNLARNLERVAAAQARSGGPGRSASRVSRSSVEPVELRRNPISVRNFASDAGVTSALTPNMHSQRTTDQGGGGSVAAAAATMAAIKGSTREQIKALHDVASRVEGVRAAVQGLPKGLDTKGLKQKEIARMRGVHASGGRVFGIDKRMAMYERAIRTAALKHPRTFDAMVKRFERSKGLLADQKRQVVQRVTGMPTSTKTLEDLPRMLRQYGAAVRAAAPTSLKTTAQGWHRAGRMLGFAGPIPQERPGMRGTADFQGRGPGPLNTRGVVRNRRGMRLPAGIDPFSILLMAIGGMGIAGMVRGSQGGFSRAMMRMRDKISTYAGIPGMIADDVRGHPFDERRGLNKRVRDYMDDRYAARQLGVSRKTARTMRLEMQARREDFAARERFPGTFVNGRFAGWSMWHEVEKFPHHYRGQNPWLARYKDPVPERAAQYRGSRYIGTVADQELRRQQSNDRNLRERQAARAREQQAREEALRKRDSVERMRSTPRPDARVATSHRGLSADEIQQARAASDKMLRRYRSIMSDRMARLNPAPFDTDRLLRSVQSGRVRGFRRRASSDASIPTLAMPARATATPQGPARPAMAARARRDEIRTSEVLARDTARTRRSLGRNFRDLTRVVSSRTRRLGRDIETAQQNIRDRVSGVLSRPGPTGPQPRNRQQMLDLARRMREANNVRRVVEGTPLPGYMTGATPSQIADFNRTRRENLLQGERFRDRQRGAAGGGAGATPPGSGGGGGGWGRFFSFGAGAAAGAGAGAAGAGRRRGGGGFSTGLGLRYMTAYGAMFGTAHQAVRGVQVSAEFDKQMRMLQALSPKTPEGQMTALRQQVMKVAGDTIFSATDVLGAAMKARLAGRDIPDITKILPTAANFAAAAGIDMTASTNHLLKIMSASKLSPDKISGVADAMTTIFTNFNTTLGEMAQGLRFGLPSGIAQGLSVNEIATSIAQLQELGLAGGNAGRNFDAFVRKAFGDPKTIKKLKDNANLDLSKYMDTKTGRITDYVGMLRDLAKAMEKNPLAVLNSMGSSQARRVAALLANTEVINKMADNIRLADGSSGITQRIATSQMQGVSGAMERFKNAIENFRIVLFGNEGMGPLIASAIESSTRAIEDVNNTISDASVGVRNRMKLGGLIEGTGKMNAMFGDEHFKQQQLRDKIFHAENTPNPDYGEIYILKKRLQESIARVAKIKAEYNRGKPKERQLEFTREERKAIGETSALDKNRTAQEAKKKLEPLRERVRAAIDNVATTTEKGTPEEVAKSVEELNKARAALQRETERVQAASAPKTPARPEQLASPERASQRPGAQDPAQTFTDWLRTYIPPSPFSKKFWESEPEAPDAKRKRLMEQWERQNRMDGRSMWQMFNPISGAQAAESIRPYDVTNGAGGRSVRDQAQFEARARQQAIMAYSQIGPQLAKMYPKAAEAVRDPRRLGAVLGDSAPLFFREIFKRAKDVYVGDGMDPKANAAMADIMKRLSEIIAAKEKAKPTTKPEDAPGRQGGVLDALRELIGIKSAQAAPFDPQLYRQRRAAEHMGTVEQQVEQQQRAKAAAVAMADIEAQVAASSQGVAQQAIAVQTAASQLSAAMLAAATGVQTGGNAVTTALQGVANQIANVRIQAPNPHGVAPNVGRSSPATPSASGAQ